MRPFVLAALLLPSLALAQPLQRIAEVEVYPSQPVFTSAGGAVYFSGSATGGTPLLWRTDGTPDGTRAVTPEVVQPAQMVPYAGGLYLAGKTAVGEPAQLYRTVGSSGTAEVFGGATDVDHLTVTGGALFFAGRSPDLGLEPWRGDATEVGPLGDVCAGPCDSNPRGFATTSEGVTVFGATDRFTGDEQVGDELWRAGANNVELVADLHPGGSSSPGGFATMDGVLYFTAEGEDAEGNDVGRELFETNGQDIGTELVVDNNPGSAFSGIRFLGDTSGGGVWGVFRDGGYEPHRLTPDGFELLGDLNGRSGGSLGATMCSPDRCDISELFDGDLYFAAEPSFSRRRLYVSDGVTVSAVPTPAGVDQLEYPTRFAGGLAMQGCDDARTSCGLYALTASGETPTLLAPLPEGTSLFGMEALGNGLVIQLNVGSFTYELWGYGLVATDAASAPEPGPLTLAASPSPATAAVAFAFDLPAPADVRLTLHDALGRRLAVLVDGAMGAGAQQVRHAVDGLAPGVYLARLVAGDRVATRSVVVAR